MGQAKEKFEREKPADFKLYNFQYDKVFELYPSTDQADSQQQPIQDKVSAPDKSDQIEENETDKAQTNQDEPKKSTDQSSSALTPAQEKEVWKGPKVNS